MFYNHENGDTTSGTIFYKKSKLKRKEIFIKCLAVTLCIAIVCLAGVLNPSVSKATDSYLNASSAILKSEMALSNNLADKLLKTPETLPFTFVLNGKKIRGIPASWKPVMTIKPVDTNIVKTTIRGTDPVNKLKVTFEMSTYKDYPVVEWIAWFENTGNSKTKLLSNINAIDNKFNGSTPNLTSCNGDFASADGYTVTKTKLAGQTIYFAPKFGRPCDGAFPYYRINFKDYGVTMAIGWPAQWYANFKGTSSSVSVTSGQETFSAKLNPGEKIRTPRMTLLYYKNGEDNGINVWRSWYRKYILIKPDGKNNIKPLDSAMGTDPGVEFTAANEQNQLKYIDKFNSKGYDFSAWWIDAGWYSCYDEKLKANRWTLVGDWRPDPIRFPNGLKIVSDKLKNQGSKLLLWFEPERVTKGSTIEKEHPQWLLRGLDGDGTSLLNLGIPACRKWLTDYIDKIIKDNGVGIYRQDYNYWMPMSKIQDADKKDWTGVVENLYVQGYLQYWDDLLARNPGLIIDSCASGGRRNDLETMRRSVPLHYSDFGYGNTLLKQSFHNTLYQWFLYFKDGPYSDDYALANSLRDKNNQLNPANDVDTFAGYVGIAPFFNIGVDIKNDNFDFEANKKFVDIWKQVSQEIIDGDYYLLTTDTRKDTMWTVRQFDLPATNEGLFQLYRNINNKTSNYIIHPKGAINSGLSYEITNVANGVKTVITGADWLSKGFTVTLGRREACILKYKAVN